MLKYAGTITVIYQYNNSASGKPFVMVLQNLCKTSDIYKFKILTYSLLLSYRHFVAELSVFVKSHRRSKYKEFSRDSLKGVPFLHKVYKNLPSNGASRQNIQATITTV